MAKLIVEIDLPRFSYQQLKEEILDNPEKDWFENEDISTGNIAIDEMYLKKDCLDNSFYVFKLIDIKE